MPNAETHTDRQQNVYATKQLSCSGEKVVAGAVDRGNADWRSTTDDSRGSLQAKGAAKGAAGD